MKVELKNIGGLMGVHSFSFEEGLSILHAPNGTGKSSLLKAIHLGIANNKIPENLLSNYLYEKEINGYVKFEINSTEYEVQLQRKGEKVIVSYSNVDDSLFKSPSEELAFIRAVSDLYQGILKNDFGFITSWYHQITEDNKYELFYEITTNTLSSYKTKRDDLKKKLSKDTSKNQDQINKLREEINELNKEIEDIFNSNEYQKSMEDHKEKKEQIDSLRRQAKTLKNKKENIIINIINLEKDLEVAKRSAAKLESQIANYNAESPKRKAEFDGKVQKRDGLENKLENIKEKRLKKEEQLTLEKAFLLDYKDLIKRETCPTCHQKLDNIEIKDLVSKGSIKVQKLEKSINNFKQEERNYSRQIKELEEELIELKNFLKIKIESLRKEKQDYDNTIKKCSGELPKLNKKKGALANDIEKIDANLLEIQKMLAKDNPYQEEAFKKQGEKNSMEKLIRKLEEEKDESSEFKTDYLRYEKFVERAERINSYFELKVLHLKKETFIRINKALTNSFELLELAKLKRIEFGEKNGEYTLEIVRYNNVYTTLEKLSGAEKSLITLIITWVVKQMVIPEEPLFLVDEVTTEMDDTRFKDILDYISEKTDYVIVARHKPYKGKKELITNKDILSSFA